MKNEIRVWFISAFSLMSVLGCQSDDVKKQDDTDPDITGRSITYFLDQASDWNVNGFVVFNERTDGTTRIDIKLNGLGQDSQHPVHLHLGDISTDDADVAALLSPLSGKTGESKTTLTRLADDSVITFEELKALNACIKIHLAASGEEQNIILAAGNIGSAVGKTDVTGRNKIGICKSEN